VVVVQSEIRDIRILMSSEKKQETKRLITVMEPKSHARIIREQRRSIISNHANALPTQSRARSVIITYETTNNRGCFSAQLIPVTDS
jgi:hypothetical protein